RASFRAERPHLFRVGIPSSFKSSQFRPSHDGTDLAFDSRWLLRKENVTTREQLSGSCGIRVRPRTFMARRAFMGGLAGMLLAEPLAAEPHKPLKRIRIGYLSSSALNALESVWLLEFQ